jgi:hypothetical protein
MFRAATKKDAGMITLMFVFFVISSILSSSILITTSEAKTKKPRSAATPKPRTSNGAKLLEINSPSNKFGLGKEKK